MLVMMGFMTCQISAGGRHRRDLEGCGTPAATGEAGNSRATPTCSCTCSARTLQAYAAAAPACLWALLWTADSPEVYCIMADVQADSLQALTP